MCGCPNLWLAVVTDTVEALVLDLLEWLGRSPRPYGEVLDAWRTSCPRLPVWEDANDRGFIQRGYEPGQGEVVSVSPGGLQHLERFRARSTEPSGIAEMLASPGEASVLATTPRQGALVVQLEGGRPA
jgi:hypothetical protein